MAGFLIGAGVAWAVVVVVVDATSRRIPNALSVPAAGVAAAVALSVGHPWAIAGGAAWWGVAVGLRRCSPRLHAGAGDAKLGLSLGTVVVLADPMGLWLALGASGVLQALGMLWWGRRLGVERKKGGPTSADGTGDDGGNGGGAHLPPSSGVDNGVVAGTKYDVGHASMDYCR